MRGQVSPECAKLAFPVGRKRMFVERYGKLIGLWDSFINSVPYMCACYRNWVCRKSKTESQSLLALAVTIQMVSNVLSYRGSSASGQGCVKGKMVCTGVMAFGLWTARLLAHTAGDLWRTLPVTRAGSCPGHLRSYGSGGPPCNILAQTYAPHNRLTSSFLASAKPCF